VTEATLPAIFGAVGAALVAVAALVFAYSGLVADPGIRRAVLVAATAVAAATTLVVRRKRFVASANAVGGLTAVLGLIAVEPLSTVASGTARPLVAAGAAFTWAVVLAAAGRALHLRVWWSAGLVIAPIAVTIVTWPLHAWLHIALVLTGAVATAVVCAMAERRWSTTPGRITVERVIVNIETAGIGLCASGAVLGIVAAAPADIVFSQSTDGVLGGAVLVVLGLLAAVMGRLRPGAWTWVAGMYLVGGTTWMTVAAVAGSDALTVLAAGTIAAALTWAVLGVVAVRLSPGRCSSLLTGGWVALAALVAIASVVTIVAVALTLAIPFGPDNGGTPTTALVEPSWANGWLLVVWLTVAGVWAWYALLPRKFTAWPRDQRVSYPGWPSLAQTPAAGPLDLSDVEVLVAHGTRQWVTTFADWVATGPRGTAGTRLVGARLQSTNQPVPLAQLDDPWLAPAATFAGLVGALAPVALGAAVTTTGMLPGLPMWATLTIWLVAAGAAWAGARTLARRAAAAKAAGAPRASGGWYTRISLQPGVRTVGLGLPVLAAQYSWWSRPTTLVVGVVVVALTLAWAQLAASWARPVLVGVGYTYALVVAGLALWWYPWGWTATWPSTIGALAVVSAVVALVLGQLHRRVGHPMYFTLLAVGAVPWLLAVTSMFGERTWGAGAACTAILAVEAVLLSSRRRPQPAVVRILAAVGLIPTASAVAVNVVPQLTAASGAPIVLPVVAALAVVAALVARPWTSALARGQMDARLAGQIRVALETSALATVVIAELLALVRDSAGGVISLLVCVIVAAGASYMATTPRRRQVWWLAWLAWSGVLWSALGLAGVDLVEAYTAPPTLVGAAIAFWFIPRSTRMVHLGGIATLATLAPTVLLTLAGESVATRTAVLVGAAVFLGFTTQAVRGTRRAPVLPYAAAGTAVAGLSPFILAQHVQFTAATGDRTAGDQWFNDAVATMSPTVLFATMIALTLVSAALVLWAATALRSPWRSAPTVVLVVIGTVLATLGLPSIDTPLLPLVLTWLIGAVLVGCSAIAQIRARDTLPPAWFWWSAAYLTFAVPWAAGWVVVEWYALPFGAAMFATGWIAVRRNLTTPAAALAPAVIAILAPSTIALFADPATWRAIMAILLALTFMLVGARKMWKSLLGLGIADMPVIVVVVFATAQVAWVPWLITLLATGGLLISLMIYTESRRKAPTP